MTKSEQDFVLKILDDYVALAGYHDALLAVVVQEVPDAEEKLEQMLKDPRRTKFTAERIEREVRIKRECIECEIDPFETLRKRLLAELESKEDPTSDDLGAIKFLRDGLLGRLVASLKAQRPKIACPTELGTT